MTGVSYGTKHATRIAVVVSHPIQYYSPWFSCLAGYPGLVLKVFYLWDFGVEARHDPNFGMSIKWDIPLLDGYESEFVRNVSRDPGTQHFRGLDNPSLIGRLNDWRPDVILLFGYAYLSHVRLILSPALRRIPIILRGDSHNLGRRRGLRTALGRLLRKALFRRVGAFLAVGEANEAYFADVAMKRDQVFLAPHFVDNARFRADPLRVRSAARDWRRKLEIPDDALVVGFVGKLEDKKRPVDLLDAFSRLANQDEDGTARQASLLFVGAGRLEPVLRERARQAGLENVFFVSFQNQTQMPIVYAAMDFLVLPSGFGETWGLCVNEAMNLGVPAIVSDVVGCGPDLVVEGKTGWTFRSGDVTDLCRTLREAMDKTEPERLAMAEQVRQHVARYSIESATEGLLRACRSVMR